MVVVSHWWTLVSLDATTPNTAEEAVPFDKERSSRSPRRRCEQERLLRDGCDRGVDVPGILYLGIRWLKFLFKMGQILSERQF